MKTPARLLALLLSAAIAAAADPAERFLLSTRGELAAVEAKARAHPWAQAILDRQLAAAEAALRAPIEVPAGPGNVDFFYACKQDGAPLRAAADGAHVCSKCGAEYRGAAYDAVLNREKHVGNARRVVALGFGYAFTGRREFARRAAELLNAYAALYPKLERFDLRGEARSNGGRLFSQTLNEADWLIDVSEGYGMARGGLAAAERTAIEQALLRPMAETIRSNHWGLHNKQSVINAALGGVAFLTGDQALLAEVLDHPQRGFRHLLAKGTTDDGLWLEGTIHYHYKVLRAFVTLAEAARVHGIDLYDERLRKMFEAPLRVALPDGSALPFNDNGGGPLVGSRYTALYELGFARYRDPLFGRMIATAPRTSVDALLYGAPEVPGGPVIPTESVLLPAAGVAVLRSGGNAAAIRFGLHGGSHGHYDKLNLVTYGAGRMWGWDPGSDYSSPLQVQYYPTTVAHNTIVVSNRLQNGTNQGRVERWEVTPEATTLVVYLPDASDNTGFRRTLTLRGDELEDTVEVIAATRKSYHWVFQAPGEFSSSLTFAPHHGFPGDRANENGYQHLKNLRRAMTDDDWTATWTQAGARMTIRFAAEEGTEIFLVDAPGGKLVPTVPKILVHRQCIDTVYRAKHRFEKVAQPVTLVRP
jgi:oligo-alginate lyase